jgi:hypothetical protein
MYYINCECFLGLKSLEKSNKKCAAIVWNFGGGFVVPKHIVPIVVVPPFTLCTHPPSFLYSGPYITTTFDHLHARASSVYRNYQRDIWFMSW